MTPRVGRSTGTIAVTGGYVLSMTGEPIPDGTVVIHDGSIAAVGRDVDVPAGAEIVDARGTWVLPGFFDAHAHVGIHEESVGVPGDDTNETSKPNMAGVRVIDGIDIEDAGFRDALRGGITSVGVKPGSGNPIGGQTVVMKTWGGRTLDEQVVSDTVSVKSAFGENPKVFYGESNSTPMTRLGIAWVIRQAFEDALDYARRQEEAKAEGSSFRRDLELESLARLLSGELLWDVHVHRHDDISTAIRVAEEFGLRLVVNHGTEAHKIADVLAERNIPVMVGPIITPRSKQELSGHTLITAGVLDAAGVKVAIITDHPEVPIEFLVLQVTLAVKNGLDRTAGLRAITTTPAEILGVQDCIGALEPGRDGDVVLWTGDPLDPTSRVERVLIEGATVYRWDDERGVGVVTERFSS